MFSKSNISFKNFKVSEQSNSEKSESKLQLFLLVCQDSECKIMSVDPTNEELNATVDSTIVVMFNFMKLS